MDVLQLNQQNIPALSRRLSCPDYDRKAIKAGIVHIGVGGFHRSHQAYYMHQLLSDAQNNEWGICGIGLREGDRKIAEVLKEQDCLYSLITQHPDGQETCEVVGSIVDFVFAIDNPDRAIERLAHSDTRIVSLTITEGGYNFNPNTGDFNFENKDIQHDLQHSYNPKTVFGFLTEALKKRREEGIDAFTILSCDNIQHNGDVARKMLLSFVERQDTTLFRWIEKEVSFPNSMVDRITPVTAEASINFLEEEYGLNDKWPVVCEPFIQWVIEDNFSNGRPLLEELGVQFVPDVTPYETMKIRLLNAGHSVLGIPGAVIGHATINACMEDKVLASFMREFMDVEVTPLLGDIAGIDLSEYKDSLEERFSNPNIKDGVNRICSESSAKLPKFLIPTIHDNLSSGGSVQYGTLIIAIWCYYSDKRIDFDNNPLDIIDARKEELHKSASQYESDNLSFLRIQDIFGDLLEHERFVKLYRTMAASLYQEANIHTLMAKVMNGDYS